MVRNTKGGNKAKKLARKNVREEMVVEKIRFANRDEPCEMYAIVEKMYGNGMCGVRCNDGMERICIIRNKFRGRNKHRNMVRIGSRLLIGLRDWEVTSAAKLDKCDLLHVYDDAEVGKLRADETINWNIMKGVVTTNDDGEEVDDLFDFTLDGEFEDDNVNVDDI